MVSVTLRGYDIRVFIISSEAERHMWVSVNTGYGYVSIIDLSPVRYLTII